MTRNGIDDSIAVGVDIGGSHIHSAAVDLATHRIIPGTHSEQKIDNKAGKEEILQGWTEALALTLARIGPGELAGIGFAMPGPFDYTDGIALFEKVEKYESLHGIDVSAELRARLGLNTGIPLRYINDATAFAIAEAWVGKGSGFERIIALTLGSGFGSAFIHDGIPVLQGPGVPEMGCVWHIPYKESIANDYFSTHWFTGSWKERTGRDAAGVKEVAGLARSEPAAMELFREYGREMGYFLAPWIRKFGSQAIVIGGNITGAFDLFGDHLLKALCEKEITVPVLLSTLKEDAAILGGARLLSPEYWHKVKDLLSLM